ncbi:kdo(2)-lipid A phosphoethanolamine 7''-transferase [Nissabacter sp. SGAir0207]|uniref:kdo(2)-lipid A phosphoethanolamine 7''-transferase n=1 Tax=Nissabacter sp. SGAir0207 TaxID=2126321 RepID=UPI0010CD184B|nr:kdo(2)-lipid A phosphoethanolamine 7''-transferase [Nissabacter sp. SGAir0207]QCR36630.1 kdo(2)-lipid A phosphoethanolamine 7''-transferase [Nissabacter sp. SGAir0207]
MQRFRLLSPQQVMLFIAIYVGVFLNAPVFYRRFMREPHDGLLMLAAEMLAAFSLVYFLCLLASLGGRWLFRLLISIMVLCSAAASYYMAIFNVDIGYGILAAVMTTDLDLSKASIGYHFILWIVLAGLPPLAALWLNVVPSAGPGRRQWLRKGGVLLAAALGCWLPLKLMGEVRVIDGGNPQLAEQYDDTVASTYLPSNWLSALGLFAYSAYTQPEEIANLFDPAKHFTYMPPQDVDDIDVVFVIGESARRDHFGLYGYGRDTTPNLSKEKNLVALNGTSCDTSTKLSLRCMFVRPGGTTDDPSRTLKEMNVFSVLKQQGFSSELFAMQTEDWFYSKTLADRYVLRDSIETQARNAGKPIGDMLLVGQMRGSLERHPHGRHLIILHTKGSHYLYSERYPRSFARWQPECMGIDEACSTQSMINAYDNSVLYTDAFLKQVIDQVRDRKAIVFYASDHGESISDNIHFHSTPRDRAPPEQRAIPIMVWASDTFLADPQHHAAFAQLRRMAAEQRPAFHGKLFDSLLGCIGFSSPDGGLIPQRNWCQTPPPD